MSKRRHKRAARLARRQQLEESRCRGLGKKCVCKALGVAPTRCVFLPENL